MPPAPGYDLATGLGSPVGNLLIPQLAGPSIVMGAAALPWRTTTNFSVLGPTAGANRPSPTPGPPRRSPAGRRRRRSAVNGSNAAKNTTATLNTAGTYVFTVTITDAVGLSVTSSVSVTVNPAQIVFELLPNRLWQQPSTSPAIPWPASRSPPGRSTAMGASTLIRRPGPRVNLDGASPSFAAMTFSAGGYTLGHRVPGDRCNLTTAPARRRWALPRSRR